MKKLLILALLLTSGTANAKLETLYVGKAQRVDNSVVLIPELFTNEHECSGAGLDWVLRNLKSSVTFTCEAVVIDSQTLTKFLMKASK